MSNNHSCGPDIVKYFIVEPPGGGAGGSFTGSTGDFSIGGNLLMCNTGSTIYTHRIEPCDSNSGVTISNIVTLYPNGNITPLNDNVNILGSQINRFRDINTISGTSTVWTSTNQVITPNLNLGMDNLGNDRNITADNSIIQNDVLNGGNY